MNFINISLYFSSHNLTNFATFCKIIDDYGLGHNHADIRLVKYSAKICKKGRSALGEYSKSIEISDIDKDKLIDILTEELPVLRAKIGLSQDDLSSIIGISRQTYSSIETGKRRMTWNTFLSLILMFGFNEKTSTILEASGAMSPELKEVLNVDCRKGGI